MPIINSESQAEEWMDTVEHDLRCLKDYAMDNDKVPQVIDNLGRAIQNIDAVWSDWGYSAEKEAKEI